MSIDFLPALRPEHPAWNKGRIIGQKRPLLPKHVWSIRVRLEMADNRRDLALFNMAIDSKLRGCDLVCLKVRDVFAAGRVKERTSVTQSKAGTCAGRAALTPVGSTRSATGSTVPTMIGRMRCSQLRWVAAGPILPPSRTTGPYPAHKTAVIQGDCSTLTD